MATSPASNASPTAPPARSRYRLLWIVGGITIAWFALAEAATSVWYSSHESKLPKNQLPASGEIVIERLKDEAKAVGSPFKEQDIGDAAMEMLKCSYGRTLIWASPSGAPMAVTAIRWGDRSVVGGVEATHNPGVCLRAAGWEIGKKTEFGVEDYCGASAEVTQWEVSQGGQRMMAYSAVFRRYATANSVSGNIQRDNRRWQAVLTGRRDAPVMVLLAYLPVGNFDGPTDGHHRFQEVMKKIFCDSSK